MRDKELREVFELYSMSQVLTIPPAASGAHKNFWGKLPDALFWIPVTAQVSVVGRDLWTFGIGGAGFHNTKRSTISRGPLIPKMMILPGARASFALARDAGASKSPNRRASPDPSSRTSEPALEAAPSCEDVAVVMGSAHPASVTVA